MHMWTTHTHTQTHIPWKTSEYVRNNLYIALFAVRLLLTRKLLTKTDTCTCTCTCLFERECRTTPIWQPWSRYVTTRAYSANKHMYFQTTDPLSTQTPSSLLNVICNEGLTSWPCRVPSVSNAQIHMHGYMRWDWPQLLARILFRSACEWAACWWSSNSSPD